MAGATASRYANKGDLTKGDLTKHLVRLTLPMTWGILAIISFQLIDTLYISMLGTEELAAISFTFPVTFGVHSLLIGMSIATSSVISRQIGSKNWPRVRRLTTHALFLAFILGVMITIVGLLTMKPLFRLLGAPEDMLPLISNYMVIWFAGSLFVNTPMVGNAAIRATGDTLLPAMIMTIVAVVNIILDPILIFGLFGFPRLEMQGAAISTVFANGCAVAAVLYILGVRKRLFSKSRHHIKLFKDSCKRFLFIAVPAGLTTTIQPITNAVIVALLAGIGTDAVAAYGIVTRVEAMAFVVIMALATGMAPIIGQNWGAGNYRRVNKTLKQAIGFAVIWSVGAAVFLGIFAKMIAGLFTDDPTIINTAALYFWIATTSTILGNLVPGWASAFNAMGRPERAFVMIVVRLVVLTIPLAWIGAKLYSVGGIFCGIAIANIVSGIVFHFLSRKYCLDKAATSKS